MAADPRRTTATVLPLVYNELKKLASARLLNERPGQTLSATALVHEVYLLLTKKGDKAAWENEAHFFAAAAESMRRILREKALRKKRIKHGGQFKKIELEDGSVAIGLDDHMWASEFLDLDAALNQLEKERPAAAKLVMLRFFSGLTLPKAAQAMEISERTAHRYWGFARAWLYRRLQVDIS